MKMPQYRFNHFSVYNWEQSKDLSLRYKSMAQADMKIKIQMQLNAGE